MTAYTTLNEIKKHDPCPDGWQNLLKHLGKTKADNEPLFYASILEINGLQDAIWALRTYPDLQQVVLFAADCAERVLHIFESSYPDDYRPRKAIGVARVHGTNVSASVIDAAVAAAADAADDAGHAAAAARDAVRAAAYTPVRAAAYTPAYAADFAARAAEYASSASYYLAEREKQKQLFLKYFGEG